MAIARNSSNQPLTLTFGDIEFRFSPQEEHDLTDEQLASEEFKRGEEYFVVTLPATNIPEADPQIVQVTVDETEILTKTDSKKIKN